MTAIDLLPIGDDPCLSPEERIISHAIARARLGQAQPGYRVGDREFDHIVRRRGSQIIARDGATWTALRIGTLTAYVFAGGPLIDNEQIVLIEDFVPPPEPRCCHCGARLAENGAT